MLLRLALVGFLMAHAAVHAGFVSPRPAAAPSAPPWPFELRHSWLLSRFGVDAAVLRVLGVALLAVTVAAYGVASLALLDVLAPGVWLAGVTIGSIASFALLLLFFHPHLVVGIAIDVALAWVVLDLRWVLADLSS